mmetsp:Transcript_62210/g.166629  ORF Transcript_62210/g.166629 Transcript_62210/m.166629 type:complete len:237 (+) Transcript_62210:665-1375(+)
MYAAPLECQASSGDTCLPGCRRVGDECLPDPSLQAEALAVAAGQAGAATLAAKVQGCSGKSQMQCDAECSWYNGVCDVDVVAMAKSLLQVDDTSAVIQALTPAVTVKMLTGTIAVTTDKDPEVAAADLQQKLASDLKIHPSRIIVSVVTSRRLQASQTIQLSLTIEAMASEVSGLHEQVAAVAAEDPEIQYTATPDEGSDSGTGSGSGSDADATSTDAAGATAGALVVAVVVFRVW